MPPKGSPPFEKGRTGGISADALLKKEMQRNMAAFFKKLKFYLFL